MYGDPDDFIPTDVEMERRVAQQRANQPGTCHLCHQYVAAMQTHLQRECPVQANIDLQDPRH